jgi:glycosyltransferase involved in cell wall biosynthesis
MKVINILFNYKKSSGDANIAGVEKSFIDYSTLLVRAGNQVLSITKPKMVYRSNLIDCGSELFEINAMGHADLITMVRMMIRISKFKPDIIICHSGRALFMARIATIFRRVPIVAINHGSNLQKFMNADYIFNVNSSFNRQIIELGKPSERTLVVPNMLKVPDGFITPKHRPYHQPLRLGSLGRLSAEKAYRVVVRALAILKNRGMNVEFYIGGVGPRQQILEEMAKDLGVGDNIKFLGWVGDKDKFFNDIDLFVLPSMFETFGIVLLEAMLYKTPMIVADSWGPVDIIENGVDGILFSKDDEEKMPDLIANLVEKLYKNKEYAEQLAENAYKKFHQKYSEEVVSKQIESILETIVKGNK